MPPVAYTESMPQAATYWPPTGNDGYGGTGLGDPEARACRWQDHSELFRDAQGREVLSHAVVYVDAAVELGGFLYLGETEEATPPAGALEVRQVAASPSLDGSEVLNKAWL